MLDCKEDDNYKGLINVELKTVLVQKKYAMGSSWVLSREEGGGAGDRALCPMKLCSD